MLARLRTVSRIPHLPHRRFLSQTTNRDMGPNSLAENFLAGLNNNNAPNSGMFFRVMPSGSADPNELFHKGITRCYPSQKISNFSLIRYLESGHGPFISFCKTPQQAANALAHNQGTSVDEFDLLICLPNIQHIDLSEQTKGKNNQDVSFEVCDPITGEFIGYTYLSLGGGNTELQELIRIESELLVWRHYPGDKIFSISPQAYFQNGTLYAPNTYINPNPSTHEQLYKHLAKDFGSKTSVVNTVVEVPSINHAGTLSTTSAIYVA